MAYKSALLCARYIEVMRYHEINMSIKILYKVKEKNDVERTHNCTEIMERIIPPRMGKFKR